MPPPPPPPSLSTVFVLLCLCVYVLAAEHNCWSWCNGQAVPNCSYCDTHTWLGIGCHYLLGGYLVVHLHGKQVYEFLWRDQFKVISVYKYRYINSEMGL